MGGTTKEQKTTSASSNAFGQSSQSRQQQQGSTSSQLRPWDTTSELLTSILGQLGGIEAGPSPLETTALNLLSSSAARGNPYAGAIGGVATELLGGGPDRTGLVDSAYRQYQAALQPFAGGAYVDPSTNPFYATVTDTIGTDVENRLKAMYAGSGRDPSGAGNYGYNLARGIAEGTAPVFQNQYNLERGRQLDAITGLYGAGNTTGGLLSSLDRARLANMQAGIGAADAALGAEMWGPLQMLQVEAQRRGIPLQTLATEMGLVLPAAQAFGTRTGATSGTSAGSSSTSGTQQGTGQSTTTDSTPFNPWSLAPLAFAPLTGGTSLAGLGANALGGGLFSLLSNGFLGGGNWLTNKR